MAIPPPEAIAPHSLTRFDPTTLPQPLSHLELGHSATTTTFSTTATATATINLQEPLAFANDETRPGIKSTLLNC